MTTNVGKADRALRIIIALLCSVLYFTGVVSGTWGVVVLLAGATMLMTSVVGWCGLYSILGVSTCKARGQG